MTAPRPSRVAGEVAFAGPRTPRERALIAAFQASFGSEGIGIHDDFFALGGHSLLAIQLLHRIRATLGADLSVRSLIEHRTIAALADHWETLARAEESGSLARLRAASTAPARREALLDYAVTALAAALARSPAEVRSAEDLRPLGLASGVADLVRVIKRDLGGRSTRTRSSLAPAPPRSPICWTISRHLAPQP